MFEKGKSYKCNSSLKIGGDSFTKGNEYISPSDNCLIDDNGTELFITMDYLKYFEV